MIFHSGPPRHGNKAHIPCETHRKKYQDETCPGSEKKPHQMKDRRPPSALSPINSSWRLITKRQEESLQTLGNYSARQSERKSQVFF